MTPIQVETFHGGTISVFFPDGCRKIGIRMSGGADSSIVGYMACLFIMKNNLQNEVTIHPITIDQIGKAYQIATASRVVEFYKSAFPEIKFGEHFTDISQDEIRDYAITQTNLTKHLSDTHKIDFYLTGLTSNPPDYFIESVPHLAYPLGRSPNETRTCYVKGSIVNLPLVNSNKRAVYELYNHFDLMHTLFPITRSCESYDMELTENLTKHCGRCYHCTERKWGFHRLI
jgi:hypothetical protein